MDSSSAHMNTCEGRRLVEHKAKEKNWKLWGPYVSERQWATVREDYSPLGSSWDYFTHEQARSRAYRWGEDGLFGITDRHCQLCFALALWNGEDAILKERLFGLTNGQGNHGEDCKECYYYLDSTPTHSYMKALYKYPQRKFPYDELLERNRKRSRDLPEFELKDTGVFDDRKYWDVQVEYCKSDENDILCRYTLTNRGPEPATLVVLPTLWFRNTWSWGCIREGVQTRPKIQFCEKSQGLITSHEALPDLTLHVSLDPNGEKPQIIFTNNETDDAAVATAANVPESVPSTCAASLPDAAAAAGLSTTAACPVEAAEAPRHFKHPFIDSDDSGAVPSSPKKRARRDDGSGASIASRDPPPGTARNRKPPLADAVADGHSPCINEVSAHTVESAARGYFKNAFHKFIVDGDSSAVSPELAGTKASAVYRLVLVPPGERRQIRCRLLPSEITVPHEEIFGSKFDAIFSTRIHEADEFYNTVIINQDVQAYNVCRQAYAGLLWSKQFYYYIVRDWLVGDPNAAKPPAERFQGRNKDWLHLYNRHILSMPDKWEYPWYAAWDTAFHMVPMANIDAEFAKKQLLYFINERYMHPNGQIPAYEFCFSDVNPPVHAWSALQVYKKSRAGGGQRDLTFLSSCFQKLILNFAWWVNQKDPKGRGIFGGGFLGLDNITVFDRSLPLANGDCLEQADGTGWMAFYAATMFNIACELAEHDPSYQGMACKFLEHFLLIADAINQKGDHLGAQQPQPQQPALPAGGLWDDVDGFYYDRVVLADGTALPIRVRSLVGLVPLFAAVALKKERLTTMPSFYKRFKWLLKYREDLGKTYLTLDRYMQSSMQKNSRMLLVALPSEDQFLRLMKYVLDENEFLSPYGIRSLSKYHAEHPYTFTYNEQEYRVEYTPGESRSNLFGGNSNWRGPIWLCMNFLMIDSLRRYHSHYGDSLKLECPTGSGVFMTLKQVSCEIARRVNKLFIPDNHGRRPAHGNSEEYANDPAWRDLVLFYEYFDGDTGRGCGASHQTGWTSLVIECLHLVSH